MNSDAPHGFRAFIRRTLFPLFLLVLILSLAANIFLVRSGKTGRTAAGGASSAGVVYGQRLPPQAFGVVESGLKQMPQSSVLSGGTLAKIGSYVVTSGLLQPLPATLPLFRDQGIDADDAFFQSVFGVLAIPSDIVKMRLLPESYVFRTADGAWQVSLDLVDRLLTIHCLSRCASEPPSASLAGDDQLIVVARDFASLFGVDSAKLPSPRVGVAVPGGAVKEVMWPLQFSGSAVLDVSGRPLAAVTVEVDSSRRSARNITIRLLSPDSLAQSEYPVASRDALAAGLMSGGMLPVDSAKLTGKSVAATYNEATLVYVLLQGDGERPMYIVPAIRAAWDANLTCAKCASIRLSTFIPALSPQAFSWFRSNPVSAPPLSSSSSNSGAVLPPLKAL